MKGVPPFTRHPAGIDYLTPYAAGLAPAFRKGAHRPLIREGAIRIIRAGGGVWASLKWTAGSLINLRLFEEPNGLTTVRARVSKGHLRIKATGALGTYSATVEPSASDANVCIRCTVTATFQSAGNLEGQDRDVLLTDRKFNCLPTGLYFTSQTGPAAGQAFVGLDTATLLYFQNFSALARYSGLTESSLVSCVGVEWPRLGLKLPTGPRAVPAGKPIVLSDVFLRINTAGGTSEAERSLAFIEALAEIHRRIEVPLVGWRDWSSIASRTIRDLGRSKQCSRKIAGATYLNAYVASDDKPPESMVQAAVLVPLAEYEKWAGKEVPLVTLLTSNIPSFYLGKLCTFTRWLPGKRFAKKETSEEEAAEKMDSWYLLHSLMNIGRLAELGKLSNELFLGCLAYIIKVARHFDYDWPVFYNRRTLRVYKRETAVGAGGEQDAAVSLL